MLEEKLRNCKKDILESNAFIGQYKKELDEALKKITEYEMKLEELSYYQKLIKTMYINAFIIGVGSGLIGNLLTFWIKKVLASYDNILLTNPSIVTIPLVLGITCSTSAYYIKNKKEHENEPNCQVMMSYSKKEFEREERNFERLKEKEKTNTETLKSWIKEEEEKIKNISLEILNTEVYHNELYMMNVKEDITENSLEPEPTKNEKVKSKQLIR